MRNGKNYPMGNGVKRQSEKIKKIDKRVPIAIICVTLYFIFVLHFLMFF